MAPDTPVKAASAIASAAAAVEWPIRSGPVPPIAEKFTDRPESAPSFEIALERSAVIALVPRSRGSGQPSGWDSTCGKTQLAAFHAESQWQARAVDLLIWIDASSRPSVLCGYADAAGVTAGSPLAGDPESVAEGFLTWLAQTNRKWLVILDDVADSAVIEGLWPEGNSGHVVITTRNPRSVSNRALTLEIGSFSRRDAMSYLVGRLTSDPEQRRGAIDLIEELDFQPLALAQAGAVIANSWTTCVEYRDLFASRLRRLAEVTGGRPPAAAVTWTIAAEQADLLLPGGAAQNCLAFAALLDGHGIPAEVFVTQAGCDFIARVGSVRTGPEDSVRSALTVLERVGLLTIDRAREPVAICLSRQVGAAATATMKAGALQRAAAAVMDALLEAWPSGDQRIWHAQMLRSNAAALQRAAGDLIWDNRCPSLLIRAGRSMDEAGLTSPAVDYWRDLAATSERLLGPGHADTLRLVEHLASACHAAGLTADAITWHRRIVDDRIRTFGSRHPLSVAALVSLSRALAAAGDFGSATAVLDATVAECEQAFGVTHPETIGVREELAAVHLSAGHSELAVQIYRRTLVERERTQGATHPDTMATRQKLAEAHLAAGEIKPAVSQYKRVLADRESADGRDHRRTLKAKGELAAAYHLAGRMARALQLYEEVQASCVRVLGPSDPDTLAASVNLARGYYAVGRGNATDLLRDTLARCEQVLPAADPVTRSARETLAVIVGT